MSTDKSITTTTTSNSNNITNPPVITNLNDAICSACPLLKLNYEKCFVKWYSDIYLKNPEVETMGCQNEWNEYKRCVNNIVKDRNLDNDIKIVEKAREKEKKIACDLLIKNGTLPKESTLFSDTHYYLFPSTLVNVKTAEENIARKELKK